jgi:hypothetical protein
MDLAFYSLRTQKSSIRIARRERSQEVSAGDAKQFSIYLDALTINAPSDCGAYSESFNLRGVGRGSPNRNPAVHWEIL